MNDTNLDNDGWMASFKDWLTDLGLISILDKIQNIPTLRGVGDNKTVLELWKIHMAGVGGGDAINQNDWETQKYFIKSKFDNWDDYIKWKDTMEEIDYNIYPL